MTSIEMLSYIRHGQHLPWAGSIFLIMVSGRDIKCQVANLLPAAEKKSKIEAGVMIN